MGPIDLTVGYFTDLEALYIEAGFPVGPVGVAVGFGSDAADAFYAGVKVDWLMYHSVGKRHKNFYDIHFQCLDHLSITQMQKLHS